MRLILSFFLFALLTTAALAASQKYTYLLRDVGGRVDWGQDGRIAFDRIDAQGWFQVWTMNEDGSSQKCLTCGQGFPKLHNGNPAWHPSGKYIVYQSLDENIKVPFWGSIYKLYTNPGAGVNNNIWVVASNGKGAWQLTDLGKGKGVLHAHFSHDGTKLLWAEMISTTPMGLGQWVMRLADFGESRGRPVISHIRSLSPGKMQWYETHDFSPDDSEILFTGSYKDGDRPDIYKYSLTDGTLTALTDENEKSWDEHAHFSPDGTKILWMSSAQLGGKQKSAFEPTEWWLMNSDGSNKKRLTGFNDKKSSDFLNTKSVAADISWAPDGKQAVGYLELGKDVMDKPGSIVKFGVTP